MKKKRLGEVLRERYQVSAEDLKKAIQDQQGKLVHLGELMLQRGIVSKANLISALAEVSRIEYVDCPSVSIEDSTPGMVAAAMAKRCCALPIGFPPWIEEPFLPMLHLPQGMILVTGPTGSGKSTTLYSSLNLIRRPSINVITVEDPVEYAVPGLNQVQVNTKAGLRFASSLRSILRQDPDRIMVGEIRDKETAEIAPTVLSALWQKQTATKGKATKVKRAAPMPQGVMVLRPIEPPGKTGTPRGWACGFIASEKSVSVMEAPTKQFSPAFQTSAPAACLSIPRANFLKVRC